MRLITRSTLFAVIALSILFVPAAVAQSDIQLGYHPGWFVSDPSTTIDVTDGWPANYDFYFPGEGPIYGTCTLGVSNPQGYNNGDSDFWNPSLAYPNSPSYLWIFDAGAYLESTCAVQVDSAKPWLFVQFFSSDMNDGVAEISIREAGWGENDWLTVGTYDTFGRGTNWVSIEGLPSGSYYLRITSRWNGRMTSPPNGGCGAAVGLQPARIGSAAPVPPEDIKVTGGGWLQLPGGKASISMAIAFTAGDDRPTGTFAYVDHVLKVTLTSSEILAIERSGPEAWIRLVALSNLGTKHTIYAYTRNGGAGEGELNISVSHDWSECTSGWPYQRQLTVGKGQIKVH